MVNASRGSSLLLYRNSLKLTMTENEKWLFLPVICKTFNEVQH